ncbi:PLP-dependent aminotransferase family protein [Pseudoduganella ginsengisoli]|uniref:Aminotransferase class I/II-fold pyridoxal phosphate-dependent enzyme n=1 Tax=Pseudoduganella ginsengisoli TaxID=1462440 RepID=A0A6L6Q2A0_9BURK|nr:PLP-dependent aminotransferase family protein [Pseudoduganella ginsengisoli]MTW03636.1 aminotransferase class I/II-fold pyridoxal phosphate-dependent enzyme [Pseudoduganella ginsengisoli]
MDYTLLFDTFIETHAHLGWPRQRLLHECLRSAIRDGTLAAGTRLASSRTLASELNVARNSVLYAYEQLASEGYVLGDRRGTVVAAIASQVSAEAAAVHAGTSAASGGALNPAPSLPLSRRARNLRPVLGPADTMGAFVPGVPALDAFPLPLWRRMLERAWRAVTVRQLNYSDPCGEPGLRAAVADYLRASRGVLCDASQVLITDGTQSSLDLCARACADDGDTVWIEDPGYAGALAAFRGAGLNVLGIPMDSEGIAPQAAHWRDAPPKLIYTTPSHQYPVGTVMSLPRRLALIADARAAGALIIEDDYDSEFRHDGPPLPAMQGLAPDAPVLYLGTFSKTMFPALRIGYVVAPPWLAGPLADMRAQSSARGRVAEQLAVAEFVRSGQFALHLRRMRRLYRQRRDALQAALERYLEGQAVVEGASAGMHLALRFIDPLLDDQVVTARLLDEGIVVNALSVHAIGPTPLCQGLMLGYAQVPAEQMEELARRIVRIINQSFCNSDVAATPQNCFFMKII